jgi:hypothetical protein
MHLEENMPALTEFLETKKQSENISSLLSKMMLTVIRLIKIGNLIVEKRCTRDIKKETEQPRPRESCFVLIWMMVGLFITDINSDGYLKISNCRRGLIPGSLIAKTVVCGNE